MKLHLLLSTFLFLTACQSMRMAPSRGTTPVGTPNSQGLVLPTHEPVTPIETPANEVIPVETAPVAVNLQKPRLSLVLGAGGLRAFAHAGLLQELSKAKIPVFAIAGLETGALPAALYAMKGQPFEPEWQMMKLKEEAWLQKGLLSGPFPKKAGDFSGSLSLMYGAAKAEDAKIPFVCPSYSSAKKQTYMMNRGAFAQMLLYCLPSLPLFEDQQGNGANPVALSQVVQVLKAKGTQLVVYIDLLADNPLPLSENGMMWGVYQSALQSDFSKVNEVVKVSGLGGFRNFAGRREALQKGQEAGRRLVQILQLKYGF
ncbi:MAG: patatin-like phospholipase family protein [Bdellovibrio sp.]